MIRQILRHAVAICIMFAAVAGWAQNGGSVIRVLDQTGLRGIAGIVLLVNPGDSHHSSAFVTSADGRAFLPHLDCDLCTVTALDPTGLFVNKTTEFEGRSPSITLTLEVQPIIDYAFDPEAKDVAIAINGPDGKVLPNQRVAIRPTVMTFETNRSYRKTTDSKGFVRAKIRPGEYTVATVIGDIPWEASLRITEKTEQAPLAVHLALVSTAPR